jgi:hypothetical protein
MNQTNSSSDIIYFYFDFLRKSTPQLDKIKQQDLKMIYKLAGDAFRGREENLVKCELWVAQRPVKLVLSLQAKMEPTSSSLISNAAVWQIVVLLV